MDFKEISDGELMMLVAEADENAKNILFEKYNYIINIVLKKYEGIMAKFHIERKEIYSEALYAFSDALNSFNQDKEASLPTFITLCIDRRLNKYIRSINTKKNQFQNDSYSLDYVYDEYGLTLVDLISDNGSNDPLINLANKEEFEELYKNIKDVLSDFESQVFDYMLKGLNYTEIATLLEKEPKQIDNTIQRIKTKVKTMINA